MVNGLSAGKASSFTLAVPSSGYKNSHFQSSATACTLKAGLSDARAL